MNYRKFIRVALLVCVLPICAASQAQKMYRCGSTYQDHACEGAQPGKEVRTMAAAPTSAASVATDSQCRQRGVNAQKIVWARQSGALAEKLIADIPYRADSARAAEEKGLILEVYQKPRNSALEVGASVEADCVDAKKQAALAAAMSGAGLGPQGRDLSASGRGASNESGSTAPAQAADTSARNIADNKKALCSSLNDRSLAIQANQRAGGNVATMDSLSRQKTAVDAERSKAGC